MSNNYNSLHQSYCKFCNLEYNNDIINTVILESNNFKVIPALGQFVEGYLLILSKSHFYSIGGIPNSLAGELIAIKNEVANLLKTHYCSPIFFEHGASSSGFKAGCCIDHAHIHAIPAKLDLLPYLLSNYNLEKMNNFNKMFDFGQKDIPYLFYENSKDEQFICSIDINNELPTQYLRKIVAKELNIAKYHDWRSYSFLENIEKTILKLKNKKTKINYEKNLFCSRNR